MWRGTRANPNGVDLMRNASVDAACKPNPEWQSTAMLNGRVRSFDRIWFPYAYTTTPFAHLAEVYCLKSLFDQSHAHHVYVFEPRSRRYLAHGDLWDHVHRAAVAQPGRIFLPLTLEMGSWIWVKKNPRQLLSRHGIFNPLIEHRLQRVLRRHNAWLEFVARSSCSYRGWLPSGERREEHQRRALAEWYPCRAPAL